MISFEETRISNRHVMSGSCPELVDLPGLPEDVDAYGKRCEGTLSDPRLFAFPTAGHNLLENARARFPQPLGKPVQGRHPRPLVCRDRFSTDPQPRRRRVSINDMNGYSCL